MIGSFPWKEFGDAVPEAIHLAGVTGGGPCAIGS